ncbi:50S ribosomal protein l4-like [Trifolium pratense]|uniref:Large ribosomal subunit protein uL4m n=1 Tax=Trifolium pratense TaxID=57577 RepID=A0A2K3NMB9_TRIPR|nr:50S ribosomal protein l4-like [Trifolium pratense]
MSHIGYNIAYAQISWSLEWREPHEAGFTEQCTPPTLDSGGITGCCVFNPHSLFVTFVVLILLCLQSRALASSPALPLNSVAVMAALISKRLLRSYGSLLGRRCFDSPNGERVVSAQRLLNGSMIQRFSTSILTPGSDEGAFPSDLLSKTPLVTSKRDAVRYAVGLCQDLLIPVTNFHNEDKGFMVLAGDVFDLPIRKDIIHRVVLWQRAKRQQGTHSTKTISEVSGTGRKPWNQKGTGRARHGSLRGPQFRGGETKHGPKPRSHAIKLNKKVRRLGLKIALSARAAEGKASCSSKGAPHF